MILRPNHILVAAVAVSVLAAGCAAPADDPKRDTAKTASVESVSPALKRYGDNVIEDGLWQRPGLAARERSIVTVAAMIARNQATELPFYLNRALDNNVTPAGLSGIITHLAFYSGWPNAMTAAEAVKPVFAARKIGADQLPPESPQLLPVDRAFEEARKARVRASCGNTGQGVQQYTTDVLFNDLWLRPDLAPRDRSLVTVSALVASGQTAQITSHLNMAMDRGLTQAQADEVLTQLAFYSGWPYVFSAMPVFKDVFDARAR